MQHTHAHDFFFFENWQEDALTQIGVVEKNQHQSSTKNHSFSTLDFVKLASTEWAMQHSLGVF